MTAPRHLPGDAHAPFLEPGTLLDAEHLRRQEREMVLILREIMARAGSMGVVMRTLGSIAFRLRCPDFAHLEYENNRYLTDIDFMAYSRDIAGIQDMFEEMGWEENMTVLRLFGDKRRIFYHPEMPLHSDVFLDRLRFCHEIDFRGRLELDSMTIPLADLLLEKLQIVEINRKDLVDVMVLMAQFGVDGAPDSTDAIDGGRVVDICRRDWGWWRTAMMNLRKTRDMACDLLPDDPAVTVRNRVDRLLGQIEDSRKTLRWKLRGLVGDRMKWYREVEEVERD